MRIRHTPSEFYHVYSMLPCTSGLFAGIERWYSYKTYSSKASALNAIKRLKNSNKYDSRLVFKIVWNPYPFCSDESKITVYSEI